MKKKIGIVGWNTSENSFGVTKPYISWLTQFGIVQILSPQEGIVNDLDLLVLPGGADIAPQSMNQVPGFFTSNTDVMKQYFYDNNLQQYLDADIPIFGICLGFQQLCVKFGGTLVQDYSFNYSSRDRSGKIDELYLSSKLREIIKDEELFKKSNEYKVNSLHHQGCFMEKINNTDIEMLAIEKTYGNIEIAKFKKNVYGVQYHPEEINDYISSLIVKKLLKI